MARVFLALIALFVASVTAHAGHGDHNHGEVHDPAVLTLEDSTFDSTVATGFSFVKFYAPWCGHCKKLAPTWGNLAKELAADGSAAKIAAIDCTVHKDACTKNEVRGYPTLIGFKDGQKIAYNGGRDVNTLKAFVTEHA
jgi:thioredoxin domain-containing protein 5